MYWFDRTRSSGLSLNLVDSLQKSTCELCGHLFSFEKVYKPGSPDRPPFTTITYQALKDSSTSSYSSQGLILVGIVGSVLFLDGVWVQQLTGRPLIGRPPTAQPPTHPVNLNLNSTTNSSHSPWINNLIPSLHLDPNSIALDIFQGQLITCAIILSFVVIFLLREWILQNTPPPDLIRLAEDEEILSDHYSPLRLQSNSDLHPYQNSRTDHLVPTPGLLELADPGLGMPFYKPHDPIDSEIFSHRILVTSTYLLFVAQVSDTPSLLPDSSTENIRISIIPDDDPTADTIKYQQIEFNWTRALLSDPKISKHIQYLFNTRCYSTATVQTQDQFRINGLVYSLLSIYNSVESQSTLLEASSEEVESVSSNTFEGYQRIYDLMRLFVLPLLDVPNRESCSQRLIQLETDINELIRKYDPVNLPDASFDDPSSLSSFMSLKDRLVEILVKQRILSTLINSTTFVRYSRGMFPKPQRVNNPENDLSEITIQLINFKATIEPRSKSSQPDEISVGWIDHATFDHKLLVTSSYLLLSDEAIETSFPVLQTPTLIDLLENSTDQEQSNEIGIIVSKTRERMVIQTTHDSSIAQFLVLILTDQNEDEPSMINLGYHTPNFFLLKLVYVYTVLETLIPRSENQQSSMIYENASKILLEHLSRLQSETPDLIHPDEKRIIGILARQKVLGMIVTDGRFAKYARAMLSEPDLFARISSLPILEQLEEEDQNILDYERIDKGKHKAPDDSAVLNDEEAAEVNSEEDRPLHAQINEEESINKSENLAESSILDQSFDPSSHIDTFDWSEDAGKSSSQASSTHPDGIDILSSDTKPIDSCLGNSTNSHRPNQPRLRNIFSAEKALPTNLPPIGTPAPGRRPMIRQPQAENVDRMPNPDIINRGRLQAAERAVAGRLPGFGPQRLQREVGIGAGLVDGFVFDDPGLNPGEDELMAEDIDGILELIGMKGSLLMLAQNVGFDDYVTLLVSPRLRPSTSYDRQKAHRLLAPPFKGLLILQGYVHRMLTTYPTMSSFDYSRIINPLRNFNNFGPWRVPQEDHSRPSWGSIERYSIWFKADRSALAVLLGYSELALMSLFYLSSGLDQQRARFVSETIVHGIQQQFLIAKVGIFIFIELVIFPFLCGLLLNFTTIPIFVNASLSNRLELYSSAPYSASLITWLVGTCFMFSFAILVSTCRESLRAVFVGGLETLQMIDSTRLENPRTISLESSQEDLSIGNHVRSSGDLWTRFDRLQSNIFTGTLPLRIHADRPISSSALDLVIYQTFLPFFLECFQPRTKLKESLQSISRYMARQLRLTCYLYGERRIAEETTLEWVVLGSDGQFRPLEKKVRFSPMNFFKSYQCPTPSSSSSGKKK
ncbi:hypothetical protein KEM48_009950 [Puccinia striiformis f. sp. tritici PST-130]|nr:hypothetical protein KEM48_009950 [Puccinia striiformis f. sp. tritici PST-130]